MNKLFFAAAPLVVAMNAARRDGSDTALTAAPELAPEVTPTAPVHDCGIEGMDLPVGAAFDLALAPGGALVIEDFDPLEDALLIDSPLCGAAEVAAQDVRPEGLVLTLSSGARISLPGVMRPLPADALVLIEPEEEAEAIARDEPASPEVDDPEEAALWQRLAELSASSAA
ncbi:hypothetical protein ACFSUD_05580 [Sulfitobacter aestuarii]|uniref:DUF177 domain-containing protein n=1 Tax=Sulfitobacter aestuarii TaxID=2161676 RepID=A0ABW5U247_9RHOB